MSLISLKELSSRLDWSQTTTRRRIKDGTLPHYKIRGRYRFDFERVLRRLEKITKHNLKSAR